MPSNEANVDVAKTRPNWTRGIEFLMSCIAVSVGLGNIWRFPFTAYENGGGAFLIPYIVVLFLIGKPMYYLEVLLGQFTSKSSVKIWSVCPSFVGVGIGQAYAGAAVLTYYSSLLAIILHYLVASVQTVLPWSYCRPEWGPMCVDSATKTNLSSDLKPSSSSELYFLKVVIQETDDISYGVGLPSWQLTIALFIAWLITFLVIVKGVKSTGKAAYFLAIFPYAVLVTLLVRAVTLEGAMNGILFFLKPNWKELLNIKVWKEAVKQCFFSLAVGLGPLVMFSSYNKFHHNVHRDAVIVSCLDTVTSIIAGVTIFGILGNLAHNLNVPSVRDVVRSGSGLAFVSYPNAITNFTVLPQLFALLFFFMLFVLGIGTLVAQANTLVAIICDHYKWMSPWVVALITCVLGFLSGLIYITPGGQWILNLVDYYGCTFVIFGLAIFQVIGISWVYGVQNFCDDIQFMMKMRVSLFWRLCWTFVTPTLLISIFVASMVDIETLKYGEREYPQALSVIGWTLLAIGFLQFPLWFVISVILRHKAGYLGSIRIACSPSEKWGPSDPQIRTEWLLYKKNLTEKRSEDATKNGRNWLQVRNVFGSR